MTLSAAALASDAGCIRSASASPSCGSAACARSYPGVVALAGFDMEVAPGEVIGLVGENGAGKSTLMKILGGVTAPDSGTIEIDGVPYAGADRRRLDARRHRLRPSGTQPVRQSRRRRQCLHRPRAAPRRPAQPRRPRQQMRADVAPLSASGSAPISRPTRRSPSCRWRSSRWSRSPRRCRVNARLVILDEPTSSLPLAETDKLLEVIAGAQGRGHRVIFISHRLHEIERACDRVVVLRDGVLVGKLAKAEINHDRMVKLMIGRDLKVAYAPPKRATRRRGAVGHAASAPRPIPTGTVNLDLHARRDPGPRRPGRLGPHRTGARPVRHRPDLRRHDRARRQAGSRCDTPPTPSTHGIFLVPEDRKGDRHPARPVDRREHLACPTCRPMRRGGLVSPSAETRAGRAQPAPNSASRRPTSRRAPAACRAATSRRWCWPSGWR